MKSLSYEIIEMLNKKQEAAFEVIFKIFYPRLVYFAKEYVAYEEARNLVQDAFVTYWENNPVVLNEAQLQSYLFTVVKHNCLMSLRHEKVRKRIVNKSIEKTQNQIYSSALEQLDTSVDAFHEMETIIEQTLADLPPRCQKIFFASRFKGKKNREVAEELNISEKAVEAQITKALKIFKAALKDFLPIVTYFKF